MVTRCVLGGLKYYSATVRELISSGCTELLCSDQLVLEVHEIKEVKEVKEVKDQKRFPISKR